jgi:hypothetical protein
MEDIRSVGKRRSQMMVRSTQGSIKNLKKKGIKYADDNEYLSRGSANY